MGDGAQPGASRRSIRFVSEVAVEVSESGNGSALAGGGSGAGVRPAEESPREPMYPAAAGRSRGVAVDFREQAQC